MRPKLSVYGKYEQALEVNRDLIAALTMMYDKWENGVQCFENPEDCEGSIGNAFKLSFAEEQTVLNLIVAKAETFEESCANCDKPYRAHLLHDGNKCGPRSTSGWFPSSIAKALTDMRKEPA